MSAIRMVPGDLVAHQEALREAYVDDEEKATSSPVARVSQEKAREKSEKSPRKSLSPSQTSIVSTADYDGSTQCDTASNPDLDDVDEQPKPQIETRFSCLVRSYGKYAHCVEDMYVMMKFAQLAAIPRITAGYAKLALRTLKMLHLCNYPDRDIWVIMAQASAYFEEISKFLGHVMDEAEGNNIIVPIVFIAHSYVLDEHCPLKVWHKHLLGNYCSLKILNAAIVQLLQQRNYILRLDDADLAERVACITPLKN